MQNPDSQTIDELKAKRQETAKEASGWMAAFLATVAASIVALTVKDWRDAEGSWKKMLSLKSPARLFKTKTSSAVTTSALAIEAVTARVGLAKAAKVGAYNEAIALTERNAAPDVPRSEPGHKHWVTAEKEKGTTLQQHIGSIPSL